MNILKIEEIPDSIFSINDLKTEIHIKNKNNEIYVCHLFKDNIESFIFGKIDLNKLSDREKAVFSIGATIAIEEREKLINSESVKYE